MKVSTLTTMALLSASCFAAPIHTGKFDSATAHAALAAARANAAPVAPPAPEVTTDPSALRGHWRRIALPKQHELASRFAAHERQART
ncbi:hypothetical protein [Trinickia diaoshuihuensis]|uniref:hypothetical protein n=1 Tax=Trinickia diaoshuihuensis TaxID=2292265 RepID=UPI000E288E04|nr:hypothetical protein [Trinickia diaoshuihuensis]